MLCSVGICLRAEENWSELSHSFVSINLEGDSEIFKSFKKWKLDKYFF